MCPYDLESLNIHMIEEVLCYWKNLTDLLKDIRFNLSFNLIDKK